MNVSISFATLPGDFNKAQQPGEAGHVQTAPSMPGSKHLGRHGSCPGPTLRLFLPKTLPNSCYVFISLIGSNRLPIEINRENISKTLKQALPFIYALKSNLEGQPLRRVNCSFRQKSIWSLWGPLIPAGQPLRARGHVCPQLGTVDLVAVAWLRGLQAVWIAWPHGL